MVGSIQITWGTSQGDHQFHPALFHHVCVETRVSLCFSGPQFLSFVSEVIAPFLCNKVAIGR